MAQKYQFEELDHETREYLLLVRDRQGKGMPGVFVPASSYLPAFGFIMGIIVLVLTLLITFPPTQPPKQEALLQTAGTLVGGWMIVAAIRIWAARSSGKYPGHFTYADPETLYEAKGSAIHITDLHQIKEARATQNFNENNYQHTDIIVRLPNERYTFRVSDEERGRRLTVFLNSVAFMRAGGEDGNDTAMQRLSPEAMGSVAKEVARTGQFPQDYNAEDVEVARIPTPKKEYRASTGFLAIAMTFLLAVGLFYVFTSINEPFRDHAIFNRIMALPEKEQPPALRLYLAHERFTAHREDAQNRLDKFYDGAANRLNGSEPEWKAAFARVLVSLKTKPVPVVSLQVVEDPNGAPDGDATARVTTLRTALADKWGSTVGDELLVFATPEDKDIKGMIDIRYKYLGIGMIEFTIAFRENPDDEKPFASFSLNIAQGDAPGLAKLFQDVILNRTSGAVINRPIPPVNLDF